MEQVNFQSWGIVEIMGHNRLAGFIHEQTIGGASFIRVDVPAVGSLSAFSKLIGASSIYAITPTTEEVARHVAESMRIQPVSIYDLPQSIQEKLRSVPLITGSTDDKWDHTDDDDDYNQC